jgi:hypothetical protein
VEQITLETSYIKPHSIAGDSIDIFTRHPETPYLKKDANCPAPVLTFRTQDNTECEILKTTEEDCLCDELTITDVSKRMTGKQVLICTYDRKSLKKPKIEHHSATHKTTHITTKKYTYCELHLEYSHIVNSKDYENNQKRKQFLIEEHLKNQKNSITSL